MKVALVHDWLVTLRGGERVLEALCELFPERGRLHAHPPAGDVPPAIENRRIYTSFLQQIPGIHTRYRHFLPLFPRAIESFHLEGYELVLSSSHCVAKGIRKPAGAKHLELHPRAHAVHVGSVR